MGFICAARTVHRHPLGGTVGIPEVSIERLVGLNGPLGSHLSPILGMGGGQNRGLNPMLQGTLCLLHGGGAEDALQSLVHLAHLDGGGCGQRV
jgi:hypothetical protein